MPSPSQEDRLRPHPEVRFSPDEDVINLKEAVQALLAEPDSGQRGHRQKALFRGGPMTLALYHFRQGSHLDDHVVDGPVVIHVLDGRLRVRTEAGQHELTSGTLLRLEKGVRHDVIAEEDSRMLLTVCLEGPRSHT